MKKQQQKITNIYCYLLLIFAIFFSTQSKLAAETQSRYSSYKPNYALILSRRKGDDLAVAVRLSGRYRFLDCKDTSATRFCEKATKNMQYKFKSFISYTHDFDFYMWGNSVLGRQSEPVVNRMTSPGLHFEWSSLDEWPNKNDRLKISSTTLSVVHHSNGQSLSRSSLFGDIDDPDIPEAILELEELNPAWRDGVSRGWNYLEAKMKITHLHKNDKKQNKPCIENLGCGIFYLSGKKRIFPIDDDIWWDLGNSSRYSDYNLLELTYSNEFKSKRKKLEAGEYSFTISCGNKGCGANAWTRLELKWPFPNVSLPWMVYIRGGPNEHFFNYHEDNLNVGVGFQFRP